MQLLEAANRAFNQIYCLFKWLLISFYNFFFTFQFPQLLRTAQIITSSQRDNLTKCW